VRKSTSERPQLASRRWRGDAPRQFDSHAGTDSAVARKRFTAVMQT
jgi:hypothetical protein